MPKLHKDFHAPRVEAYDIAISALEQQSDSKTATHEQRVERLTLVKRLRRERNQQAEKFGVPGAP